MLKGATLLMIGVLSPLVVPVSAQAAPVRTIVGSCDKNGHCQNPTTGVKPKAKLLCTEASGNKPNENPTACYVICVPTCGPHTLKKGEDAYIPNGGTITLSCNGQAPTHCTLQITE